MKRLTLSAGAAALAIALAIGGVALANNNSPAPAASVLKVDNFRLTDNNGFAQDLRRLVDVKAIVVVSQLNGDAGSRKAAKELEALKAANPGVAFFMLNSNLGDTSAAIAAEARAQGWTVPVLRDDVQLAGEQLGVTYAGEAFLIEPKTLKVLYHGPVGAARAQGQLAAALADVTAARPVRKASVTGRGAAIAFPERARVAQHQAISYARDVAPILEAKCVACHQPGGIGPFAMTDYNMVKGFAPMIREAIRTRTMPPWHPDPSVGKFVHDGSLSPEQVKTIVHWVEAGAPRGEGDDPLARAVRTAPEWPLGKPDLIIEVPAYTVPASGVVDYQYPVAANPLTEGRWVRAATLLPGDRQATHHILSGYIPRPVAQAGVGGSMNWEASYGEYAVGGESLVMPPNVGILLPAGGSMGFQMHYTPYGKEAVDRSKMGFYFYPEGQTPERVMRHLVIANSLIEIPPGDDNHMEQAYQTFPKEANLYAIFVHTHYRGRAARVEMITPEGVRSTLLTLPRYDFNWQRTYNLSEPVRIPAGSKIVTTYWYDNSVRNSSNPDPTKTITWGPQSWEEMHYTSLYYQWTEETSSAPNDATRAMNAIPLRIMGMLDQNIDGKVAPGELRGRVAAAIGPKFAEVDTDKDGYLSQSELGGAMRLMGGLLQSNRNPTP